MRGHWWCQHCNQELSSREVTFEENHDNCGGTAIWIEEEDIDEVEFLKRQLAEASERVDELYQENMVLKADMESNKQECCACQKERDELQAQVAVLRGALEIAQGSFIHGAESVSSISEKYFGYEVLEGANQGGKGECSGLHAHLIGSSMEIDEVIVATPAEAAERVQKLVAVEQAAREYVESNSIKMSIWLGSSESLHMEKIKKLDALCDALNALSEWRRDKC